MCLTGTARRTALTLSVAAAITLAVVGVIDVALAQGTPFGAPKGAPPAPPSTGIVGWIMVKQAEFYKGLSGAIRAAKTDWSALWVLFGLSFAYGIFHAAGPGHGKAVISSYVVANRETWWRGVVLSFASAMLQAAVAVALVGIAAVILNATAATMRRAVYWIEIVSYSLIIAIGLRLVWVKGRAALSLLHDIHRPKTVSAAATPAHLREPDGHHHQGHDHHHCDGHAHDHGHDHHHHGHAHDHGHGHHGHAHAHHHHDEAAAWGHAHAPEPQELAGPGGWKRGLTAIVAVGLRPCSGAILVLVFTLAQGLFWAGVVSTFLMGLGTAIMVAAIAVFSVIATGWAERFASARGGYGMLFMRGLEIAAALLITVFGVLLLMGFMATERMFGV